MSLFVLVLNYTEMLLDVGISASFNVPSVDAII